MMPSIKSIASAITAMMAIGFINCSGENSMVTSSGRGMGALDQPDDVSDVDASTIVQPLLYMPDNIDLSAHAPEIGDQGSSNSCVGWAVATAAYMRASIAKTPKLRRPSAMALYGLGRAMLAGSPSEPLIDLGSQPRMVLAAAVRWGLVAEERWSFDISKINQRPSWAALDSGVGFDLQDYSWIMTNGDQRVADMQAALANGYPIILSIVVDDGVDKSRADNGWLIGEPFGDIRGNHMVTIIGYRTVGGRVDFQMINSWGTGWGDGGRAWLTDARITDPSTRQIAIIRTVAGETK